MAVRCLAFRDAKGGLHGDLHKATLEDLAGVLGRVGDEGGMTAGVAKLIFEKRAEIERVFAEHDAANSEKDSSVVRLHIAEPEAEAEQI